MTDWEELWKTNLHLAQSINELTADIVKLKQNERENKENERVIEDLKSKYYVTLADLNQERIKKKNTMRLWHRLFFWKN